MPSIRRVVVGVSGGVDSAVAALLLKVRGFEVLGVFMKNWDLVDESGTCSAVQDEIDAQWVCEWLGIKLHHVNFVKEYWLEVFSYLLSDYTKGYTPNPDIMCNRYIKFNSFFKFAVEELGADAIATGHYARTSFGDFLENYKPNLGVHLLKPVDAFKDQTFFLSQVKQEPLQKTMFPLGNLTKPFVKQIAHDVGMEHIVKKKESTGICFIGSRNFPAFLSEYIDAQKGQFIDVESGSTVGVHSGIHNWTVGQRCKLPGFKHPYYVLKKDSKSQIIYVVPGSRHPSLFTQSFFAEDLHWIHSAPTSLTKYGILPCQFRFQHTKPLVDCKVILLTGSNVYVKVDLPLRAVTPGQYAVFYMEQECLGSARISHVGPSLFSLNQPVDYKGLLHS